MSGRLQLHCIVLGAVFGWLIWTISVLSVFHLMINDVMMFYCVCDWWNIHIQWSIFSYFCYCCYCWYDLPNVNTIHVKWKLRLEVENDWVESDWSLKYQALFQQFLQPTENQKQRRCHRFTVQDFNIISKKINLGLLIECLIYIKIELETLLSDGVLW